MKKENKEEIVELLQALRNDCFWAAESSGCNSEGFNAMVHSIDRIAELLDIDVNNDCPHCGGSCVRNYENGIDAFCDGYAGEECQHPNAIISDDNDPLSMYCPDCETNYIVASEEE